MFRGPHSMISASEWMNGKVFISIHRFVKSDNQSLEAILTRRELEFAQTYRSARRYREFVVGRFLAKRAALKTHRIAERSNSVSADLKRIEILPESVAVTSARRIVRIDGRRQPGSISISHADSWTAVAITSDDRLSVGIDLVIIDSRIMSLQSLWLSSREQRMLAQADNCTLSMAAFWAIKEALFKAAGPSHGFVPREWETFVEGQELHSYQAGTFISANIHLFRFPPDAVMCLAITPRGRGVNERTI